ncbi:interleukin-33 [Phyllostomus discolor]|uniref:Interleukin-33 n=1 Tax=Phyllostomus discolor TaxID=89673 RepID=A0A7E6DAM2_9CHIR|nr:interleukin-33 [Phyllostomus discolor]
MKHSTTRISPAKVNNLAGKALVKSPSLRKSQQKVEEVCQMYFMKLRSGHIIENRACYFRERTIKRHPPKTRRKYNKQHLVITPYQQPPEGPSKNFAFDVQPANRSASENSFSLSTYNDQFVTFAFADGSYEIYVEDLGKKTRKRQGVIPLLWLTLTYKSKRAGMAVLLNKLSRDPAPSVFVALPTSACFKITHQHDNVQLAGQRNMGDDVDGERLMVSLSPSKDKDFLLHANNQEHSVELQKCENPLPDQTFFFLHQEPGPSSCVSFECKSNPGVFIGVKDNHLALIQLKDQTEHSRRENIKFKLS